ncbi:WD40 repeat domain-containing serine/threonine protein kinase [Actinacidiphila epipremni]|nr:serine/threonine-protein kinase [Actinacidiphila epipremni]
MGMGAERVVGGRYRLLETVGRGGMGRVWRGYDETLHREVALKEVLLPVELTGEERAAMVARALREARAAARLRHPGIVTVHDVVREAPDGTPDASAEPWIVMEYVPGESLARTVREPARRLPWPQVAALGAQIAAALAHAHAAGIVHRDLKPDNVLLADRGPVITDFGIARVLDATTRLTHTGTIVGTPQYMAPEQLEGRTVESAADLWALGATLYAAVEGRAPFDAPTLTALYVAILTQPPAPPEHAGPLAEVLTALLAKDAAERPSAEDVAARLRELAAQPAPLAQGAAAVAEASPVTPERQGPEPLTHPATVLDRTDRPAPTRTAPRPRGATEEGTPTPTPPVTTSRGPSRRTLLWAGAAVVAAAGGGTAAALALRDQGHGTSRELLSTLRGFDDTAVNSVAYSPDGTSLAVTSLDGSVSLYDTDPNRWRATLTSSETSGSPRTASFSPDGKRLAVAFMNTHAQDAGFVAIWDVATQALAVRLEGLSYAADPVTWTPDGKELLAGSGALSTLWWSTQPLSATSKANSLVLPSDSKATTRSVAARPRTTSEIAIGLDDGAIYLCNLQSNTPNTPYAQLTSDDPVTALAFSPDGRQLVSGGVGTRFWNPTAAARKPTEVMAQLSGTALAFSPDGTVLAIADAHDVHLLDAKTHSTRTVLRGHTDTVTTLAFSPTHPTLTTGATDATLRQWDVSALLTPTT